MNKSHVQILQDKYTEAVNGYVAAYNNKHNCSPVCWLNGVVGGFLIYDKGRIVPFSDIKADIDNEA